MEPLVGSEDGLGDEFTSGADTAPAESSAAAAVGRRWSWQLALGAALAGAVVLAVRRQAVLAPTAAHVRGMSAVIQADSACVGMFEQCGGKDFGSECCAPGCACVFKKTYYSQCEAPNGGRSCDVEAAKAAYDKAYSNYTRLHGIAEKAKTKKRQTAKAQSEAEAHLHELSEKRLKAIEDKRETTRTAPRHVALAAAADAAADEASSAAADASAKAAATAKAAGAAEGVEAAWKRATRGGGAKDSCPKAFAPCEGAAKCCKPGCACMVKNAYYSQCEGPPGRGACDEGGASSVLAAAKANATKWKKMSSADTEKKDKAAEAAAAAEAKQRDAHDAADKAKALLLKSTDLVVSLKKEVEAARKHLRAARREAREAADAFEEANARAELAHHVANSWKSSADTSDTAGAA